MTIGVTMTGNCVTPMNEEIVSGKRRSVVLVIGEMVEEGG
jgi:hypothetical protein